MLFNKNSLKFEQSVKLNEKFKRYELLIASGEGFYYFKNQNQVNSFATAYTNLVDEIIFTCELLLFKLNSFTSFMTPVVRRKDSQEKIFFENLYECNHYLNSLKLAKHYPCDFYSLNSFVYSAIDCILNMCVRFDKKLINDVNQVYQIANDLRCKFYFILNNYQKTLDNSHLTIYSTSTLLHLTKAEG